MNLKKNLSYIAVVFITVVYFILCIDESKWENGEVIRQDAQVYYAYLPATFIQDDPLFRNELEYDTTNHYWVLYLENGNGIPKMSMGVAFLELPFFFIAHAIASLNSNIIPTGFTPVYQYLVATSSVFYAALGFLLLCIFLRRRFSDLTTAITLFFIAFGTNLYNYCVYDPGLSHPYTFFLLACFLLIVDNFLNNKSALKGCLMGVVFGLIVLVRPINILFSIPVFLMFKPASTSWKAYLFSWFDKKGHLFWSVFCAFLVWIPQLIFWKIQSGNFLFYSYQTESFFWLNPHVWEGLFSFRKGWFIYTPMMFFACFGLIMLYKKQRAFFMALAVFLPLFLYITFSWWCWWYGGSFGARTLVDILPLMALPLSALIKWMLSNRWRLILFVFPLFFTFLNVYQTWQFGQNILHYHAMTYKAYKKIFLKTHTTDAYFRALRVPDYENAQKCGEEKKLGRIL